MPQTPYLNTLAPHKRLRGDAAELIYFGLGKIIRFKSDPYLPPDMLETTEEHVKRVAQWEADAIRACVADPFLAADAVEKSVTMIRVHDVDEISEELNGFYLETDEAVQERLKKYKNFTEKTAEFWLQAAYVTAAAHRRAHFEELVAESHSLIPPAYYQRVLYADEVIDTYDKLDGFFGKHGKDLTAMAAPYASKIAFNVTLDMDAYADIEQRRTLLGAIAKLSEKRDGTYFHASQEKKKIAANRTGGGMVAHAPSQYFLRQTGRYEPIIPEIVFGAQQEPDYIPYVLQTVRSAYESSMLAASFKPFFLLDTPPDEPGAKTDEAVRAAYLADVATQYGAQKPFVAGEQKPNRILSQRDVMAEYAFAADLLTQGQVVLPTRRSHGRDVPASWLSRDAYAVFQLA